MGSVLGGSKAKQKPAQPYKGAQFQPYTYTSQVGTTTGKPVGSYGFNVESQIDPRITSLGNLGLSAAEPFLTGYLGEVGKPVPMFGGVDDGEQRAADIFRTQSALLQPEFAQQRQQLKSDMFGSGRLGLQLSGEAAGAGTGMVQPDAYGLGLAQSRALAELSGRSRQQAQQEQQQAFTQALQGYSTNQAAEQQRLANLMGGYTGALGGLGAAVDIEQALVNQGLSIEQARAAAQSASAQGGAALQKAGITEGGSSGLFGALTQGIGSSLGDSLGDVDWIDLAQKGYQAYQATGGSDKKLKTNIKKVGQLPSGLTTYTWDWKEEFKHLVGNQPTLGVIAQEAMELFPEAVSMHPDGYLQVNYARVG